MILRWECIFMKKQSKIKTYLTLTIIVGVFALISIIIFSNKQDTATLISASSIPYTASNEKDYVYLTDLWNTDKMLEKKSSWNDARALKINQNEPGDLISLNVDGTRKYFINGLFAHAESTLIFDITDFTALGYDTFTAYLGVDTYASSNGNGVKFTILASKDNKTYTELYQTEALKGISDAKEVKIPIREYNYLKLFVDDINGNNTSDHAVYANAMIYNSQKHNPNTATQVDWIKSIEEYDKELKNYKPEQILEDQTLELKLLQRTLVNRVGYQVMQAYATSDDTDRVETLKWLFTNYNVLKAYISGGEPLGNYVNSFNVLSSLYHEYHDDLTSSKYSEKNKETFFKMMISISLTHS